MIADKYFDQLPALDKVQIYINNMRAVLNTQALFADGTDAYRKYTPDGDGWQVWLRFRTARDNAESVRLITDKTSMPMSKQSSDRLFDYYEIRVRYPDCGSSYYFEAASGKTHAYYNKQGVLSAPSDYYDFVFRPQIRTPDWAKGAIFYQLFVDRFRNGDPSNDIVDSEYSYLHQRVWLEKDWDSWPKTRDVCHFYGGDLQGVLDRLDYLQGLGVEVLYLNPIFISPSNHKYDVQDYDYIDPHFTRIADDGGDILGWNDEDNSHASKYIRRISSFENLEASNAFFAHFVEEVHKRGMRVILDGVFNHCGSFNKWMDRERIYENQPGYAPGAYVSAKSPYHDFFRFNSSRWPYNNDYEGWWGHETLPKLNYESSQTLYQYVMKIARKWVSPPYNVDGWRLDVAADLGYSREFNHRFWRDFRKAVKEANPDALILAENYSDPAEWLDGDQWDTVMNYQAFMEPVTWFLTGMEKHSDSYRDDLYCNFDAFQAAMLHHMSRFHSESILTAMNELSNHDHSRFLTRTNRRVGRIESAGPEAAGKGVSRAVMREAVIMQMTWPGAPTVYYGDEAGLCGWTDPDNRRTYPWGHEDAQMLSFHREIIAIHRQSSALRLGSIKMLCGDSGYMSYGRFDEHERYVIAVNNRRETVKMNIPVWQTGIGPGSCLRQLIMSTENDFTVENKLYNVRSGQLTLELPPFSGAILCETERPAARGHN